MRIVALLLLLGCKGSAKDSTSSDDSDADTDETDADTDADADADTDTDTDTDSDLDAMPDPACWTWAEGTDASDDGATRDYYNRGANLAWTTFLGDWLDANGTAQGDVAWAVTTLTDDNQPALVEWDVTALVQRWIDGDAPNRGFLLKLTSGVGPYRFRSREHGVSGEMPVLQVTTASGTTELVATADTYLPASTYQSQGQLDQLTVRDTEPALVRFDLSSFAAGDVTGATLQAWEFEDYGGGTAEAGVFEAAPGSVDLLPPVEQGIAAAYVGDVGIDADPDVVFAADFETADWADGWSVADGTLELVTTDPTLQFQPHVGQALRAEVPAGSNLGMSLRYRFAEEIGSEPEQIYFRYYLRIADDWDPTDGGKMPGFGGTYGVAGWGGRPVDGTDGWSARGQYAVPPPLGNPFERHVPIGNYVYHADMAGTYGDPEFYDRHCGGLIAPNRWYAVEQYLQLNTPGVADGVLRAWVDGRLVHDKTDWRWRDVDTLKIEEIWMNVYHGGTDTPPTPLHLYIDNVVIANAYIGP